MVAELTSGNMPLPHVYYPAEFGHPRLNGVHIMKEICLKI